MTNQSLLLPFLLVLAASTCSDAFTVKSPFGVGSGSSVGLTVPRTSKASTCYMAKQQKGKKGGKGFGEAPTTATPTKSKKEASSAEPFEGPMATKPQPQVGIQASPAPTTAVRSSYQEDDLSQGKAALERLRRQKAEEKDAELRKVKEVRDMDKMLQSTPDAAAIPEKVAMRMGKRMLPFVGIPLFGSMGVFVGFWYFATYKNMEFQPGLVATSTIALLASSLLGITYSVVSASWDEDREGSFLGVDEFQKNVGSIREGLNRSKENMLLRERMAGMPEAEIERAIADLEKRERREKSSSLQSKLEEELDN